MERARALDTVSLAGRKTVVLESGVEAPLLVLILAAAGLVELGVELVAVVVLLAALLELSALMVVWVLEELDGKNGFDSAHALVGRLSRSTATAPASRMRHRGVGRWCAVTSRQC